MEGYGKANHEDTKNTKITKKPRSRRNQDWFGLLRVSSCLRG